MDAVARTIVKRISAISCIAFNLALLLPASVRAQSYVYENALAYFGNPDPSGTTNSNGGSSVGELVQTPDGSFFGVAWMGGANGTGTVFVYKRGAKRVLQTCRQDKQELSRTASCKNVTGEAGERRWVPGFFA